MLIKTQVAFMCLVVEVHFIECKNKVLKSSGYKTFLMMFSSKIPGIHKVVL